MSKKRDTYDTGPAAYYGRKPTIETAKLLANVARRFAQEKATPGDVRAAFAEWSSAQQEEDADKGCGHPEESRVWGVFRREWYCRDCGSSLDGARPKPTEGPKECRAKSPGGLRCTENLGHAGQHAASDGYQIVEVWRREPTDAAKCETERCGHCGIEYPKESNHWSWCAYRD